jgi:hypothetical protein
MTNTEIKQFNNANIRAKTESKSISTDNVATALDNIVDYVDDSISDIPQGPAGPQGETGPQGPSGTQSFKSYIAYLSYGSGTGFVVQSTVVYNDLGYNPTWSIQGSLPIFRATATGVFTLNKTVMFTDIQVKGQNSFINAQKNNNINYIDFWLTDVNGDLSFTPFSNLLVEIRVYN